VTETEEQHVETKQEKQASDTAAVLQDELIQAAVRERQLQMQLDKMKAWLEQRPNLQKELERQHEIKQRDSMFNDFSIIVHYQYATLPVRGYLTHCIPSLHCLSVRPSRSWT